ncbi:MAG: hypothetical protein ACRC0S_06965 [Fusobacteriaceae bacterium]
MEEKKEKFLKKEKNNKIFFFDKEVIHSFSLLGYIGFLLIGNIMLYVGIYKIIEKFLIKSALLFVILLILGIFSGFYSVYRVIMKR